MKFINFKISTTTTVLVYISVGQENGSSNIFVSRNFLSAVLSDCFQSFGDVIKTCAVLYLRKTDGQDLQYPCPLPFELFIESGIEEFT